ncbi:MAG: hypothetical protein NXH75_11135 [Halobacteriovoraceae bacterium]|nr:hypothetical protein [Halobacteriovoraceae bacterium]
MKTYFIFILIAMIGFSGYILTSRPGALEFDVLSKDTFSSLTSLISSQPKKIPVSRKPPYISYVSGDVLVNAGAQSYTAQPFQTLRIGDEIFTLVNGKIILYLGKEQYVYVEPGTKITLKGIPKRKRGFTDLIVKKGNVLVDFFEGKDPVGIRLELPNAFVLTPGSSFRVKVKEGNTRIAVDRKAIMVQKKDTEDQAAVSPGSGILIDKMPMEVGTFPWVDSYNWDKVYNQMAFEGIGTPTKLKAPALSDRTPEVNRAALRPKRRVRSSASVQIRPTVKTKEPEQDTEKKMKGIGKKALNALSKIPVLGKNVTKSTETIGNFEEIQKDRTKTLDNLDKE